MQVRLIDSGDTDGLGRAGLDASRRFPNRQPLIAHVAFANDPQPAGIARHVVRAFHDAVLAADALIIQVANDAGNRILLVS